MKYTDEQRNAITKEGDVLVSASAGSGKTTVLVDRIMHFISLGIDLERMLVLVYNKHAAEAKTAPPCADLEIYKVMKAVRAVSRNKERKRDDQTRRRYKYAPSTRREPKAYTFKHSHLPPPTACFSSRKLPPQSAL